MDWQEEYKAKLVSAVEAVRAIRSGNKVYVPIGGEPQALCEALAARLGEITDVEFISCAPRSDYGWFQPGWEMSFSTNLEVFAGTVARPALEERRADYTPFLFSLQPKPSRECWPQRRQIDVFMTTVSSPNRHGYCSFGASLWNKRTYAREARIVLAEVDSTLIRTYGDNYIHVSEIDYFVEHVAQWPEAQARDPDPNIKVLAELVGSLIRDGDTIQIGTGTATAPLPLFGVFENKHDLGWHSEITPVGVISLMKEGIFTGKRKTLHRGKFTATSLSADPAEQAYANENPAIELFDVDYINDIRTIAAHDNMVAINNALCVDLTGQIAAEGLGPKIFNGSGGQPEFSIGAVLSKGGRSITVVPSTTSDEKVSRIVPMLEPGTSVTVPRSFADYIVTEYGIVRLLGLSQRQRAEALISVAHPNFRSELKKAAKKMFYP